MHGSVVVKSRGGGGLNSDLLINHVVKFFVPTVTHGDLQVHSDVTGSAKTEAVLAGKTKKPNSCASRWNAAPREPPIAVSPVGYDFTFAFTIKCSLEVMLARRCTRTHRETKQEEHK